MGIMGVPWVAYDPAWAFEISYILEDALHRMYGTTQEHPDGENIFFYLTVYNEPYVQPAEPSDYPGGTEALRAGILGGLYKYQPAATEDAPGAPGDTSPVRQGQDTRAAERPRAHILASGVALRWALDAQRLLAEDWNVAADVWSATSWTELRRDAIACDEWNLLH